MLTDTVLFWEDSLLRSKKIQKADPVIKNTYKRSFSSWNLQIEKWCNYRRPGFDQLHLFWRIWIFLAKVRFIAWALAAAGRGNLAKTITILLFKNQRADGLWSQRYYSTGQLAPGWGDQR